MEKFDADHIIIHNRDAWSIQYVFFYVAEEGYDEGLMDWTDLPPTPSERVSRSFVYRAWMGEEIEGLEMIHSDLDFKIYRKI